MKIVIDGRCFTSKATGVSNFTLNAINSFSNLKDFEIYICAHKRIDDSTHARLLYNENVKIIIESLPILKGNGLLWFLFKLPFLANKIDPDFFWGPGQALPFFLKDKIKRIVTVHDFVYRYYPQTMSWKSKIESRIFTSYSINKAEFIWCVSNYTKVELERLYPKRKCEKIFVGSGIDSNIFKRSNIYSEDKIKTLGRYNVKNRVMLCVGTLEPRKNLKFLLEIMPFLEDSNVSLLIVGNKGWGNSGFEFQYASSNIHFTGYINSEDLVKLYNVVDLFICPSINEGFGMPILEAISCGCPVITAHNSAMIELGSNFGTTVIGWDKKTWIYALLKILDNPNNFRRYLISY
jgi:glycosyltransferase involved in cell wall biosynthesis